MVLVVVLIVGVSAKRLSGKAGLLTDTAGVVKRPMQSAVSTVIDWFESLYGYIYEYDKLMAENESLRAQLAEAQELSRLGGEALRENENLRELLNLRQRHTDFTFESARIVNWNSSNWSSTFTISKGESSGLQVGMPVVTEAGELVGQIAELGETWANVKTVIDVDMNVGVLIGEGGGAAMCVGDFNLMQDGCCKVSYLTEGASLLEGDAVLTSGRGGAFPQGLMVGTIKTVLTEAGGQMPYGILEPNCDLDTISQIFVITAFTVVE